MSVAAPANFNAEEADNLEDVRWRLALEFIVRVFEWLTETQIEKQFAVKGNMP